MRIFGRRASKRIFYWRVASRLALPALNLYRFGAQCGACAWLCACVGPRSVSSAKLGHLQHVVRYTFTKKTLTLQSKVYVQVNATSDATHTHTRTPTPINDHAPLHLSLLLIIYDFNYKTCYFLITNSYFFRRKFVHFSNSIIFILLLINEKSKSSFFIFRRFTF